MNLSSDQGWSSGESTRLPRMWPCFNATVFVSSLNAPPQQTATGGALRDETKTGARETNWLQHNLLASSPCMGSKASREFFFACRSRVTSRDFPKWKACSQASSNRSAISGYVWSPNPPTHARSHEWCPLPYAIASSCSHHTTVQTSVKFCALSRSINGDLLTSLDQNMKGSIDAVLTYWYINTSWMLWSIT